MRLKTTLAALAFGLLAAPLSFAQVMFETPKDSRYVIERVNPRAAQLLRGIQAYELNGFIPNEQFKSLDRPYKNAGVWATSPYTIMRKASPEAGDSNYFEMKELLKQKEASPAEMKDRQPAPRAIIKIPLEPERKPLNPNADQGRVTITPWKPAVAAKGSAA